MPSPSGAGRRSALRDRNGERRQAYTRLQSFDSMLTHCANPEDARSCCCCASVCATGASTITSAPTAMRRRGAGRSARGRRCWRATAPIWRRASPRSRRSASRVSSTTRSPMPFPAVRSTSCVSDGYFEVEMRQHGLLRPLKTAELSDGTLRYLLLVAALLSPRPPALMILNEPGDQPASRSPAAARPPDRARVGEVAGRRRLARRGLVSALQEADASEIVLPSIWARRSCRSRNGPPGTGQRASRTLEDIRHGPRRPSEGRPSAPAPRTPRPREGRCERLRKRGRESEARITTGMAQHDDSLPAAFTRQVEAAAD